MTSDLSTVLSSPTRAVPFAGRPDVVAHRGAQIERTGRDSFRVHCENTVQAFVRAAEMGADAIELDVIAVKNRAGETRLLVHHDDAWGRLFQPSDSNGLVKQTGFAEGRRAKYLPDGLKASIRSKLDCDDARIDWRDSPSPTVPTLDEVLNAVLAVKPDMKFFIEMKTSHNLRPVRTNKLEEALVRLVNERGLKEQATLIGFNPWSVARVKRLDPGVKTGWDIGPELLARVQDRHLPNLMRLVSRWMKADVVLPTYSQATEAFVQAAHRFNRLVMPWVGPETVAEEASAYAQLSERGVDGIITNAPGELRDFLKSDRR